MVLLLSGIAALVLWVFLWGLDMKALDALMISLLVIFLAITVHMVLPYLPGRRPRDAQEVDPAPFH